MAPKKPLTIGFIGCGTIASAVVEGVCAAAADDRTPRAPRVSNSARFNALKAKGLGEPPVPGNQARFELLKAKATKTKIPVPVAGGGPSASPLAPGGRIVVSPRNAARAARLAAAHPARVRVAESN